ncbi:uncharacterized protein LOC144066146 [Stigmatopora argus]
MDRESDYGVEGPEEVIAQSSSFIEWKLCVAPRWKAKLTCGKRSKYLKYSKSTSKILNGLLSSHRLQSATSKMSNPAVGFHPRRRPLVSSCPPEGAAAQDD